jgi:hypothetical protein
MLGSVRIHQVICLVGSATDRGCFCPLGSMPNQSWLYIFDTLACLPRQRWHGGGGGGDDEMVSRWRAGGQRCRSRPRGRNAGPRAGPRVPRARFPGAAGRRGAWSSSRHPRETFLSGGTKRCDLNPATRLAVRGLCEALQAADGRRSAESLGRARATRRAWLAGRRSAHVVFGPALRASDRLVIPPTPRPNPRSAPPPSPFLLPPPSPSPLSLFPPSLSFPPPLRPLRGLRAARNFF